MDAIKTAKVWIGERKGITSPIHVSQYDTAWTFQFKVYKDDLIYEPENTVSVIFTGKKSDDTVFAVPADFEDGVATVASTVAMTSAAGIVECELRFSESEETVGTANFDMVVEASPVEGGTPSEDDFTTLQTMVDAVAQNAAAAEAAADTAAQEVLAEVPEMVYDWLEANVAPETGYVLDSSFTLANAAANSKAVGDAFARTKDDLNAVGGSIVGGTITTPKAKAERVYSDKALSGATTYVGQDVASAVSAGASAGPNIYKIYIGAATKIIIPLFKTSGYNGSVITDINGVILAGIYNRTENTGTLGEIGVPEGAAWLYLGTNSALEATSWSVVVYNDGVVQQSVELAEEILDSNALVLRRQYTVSWEQGNVNPDGSPTQSSSTRCRNTAGLPIAERHTRIYVPLPSTMQGRITFYNSMVNNASTLIASSSNTNWTVGSMRFAVPTGAVSFRVSVAYASGDNIVPADCSGVAVYQEGGREPDNPVAEFDGKIISILGDSISTFEGYTYPGNRNRYPQDNLLTDVDDTYWKRLIDDLGLTLGVNESWAGSCVSNTSETDHDDVGPNRHIASATRIGHLGGNGTPDIILVNAGTNDIGKAVTVGTFNTESPVNYTAEQIAALPVATFADAYRAMLIRLQKSYPDSVILCLLPNYTTSYYTPTQADAYCEVIKEACDYFGIKWYDMRASGVTMFNRGTYLPDGIHYNAKGMELIYKELRKDFLYDVTTL